MLRWNVTLFAIPLCLHLIIHLAWALHCIALHYAPSEALRRIWKEKTAVWS